MPERPQAYISHHTAERTRIKVPSHRRDAAFFEEARRHLAGLAGVQSIQVNPVTASLLLRHSRDFAWPSDTSSLPFSLAPAHEPPASLSLDDARREFQRVNRQLATFTGGTLDLKSLAFLTLVVMSIIQIIRGNIATSPVSTLWYASRIAQLGPGAAL